MRALRPKKPRSERRQQQASVEACLPPAWSTSQAARHLREENPGLRAAGRRRGGQKRRALAQEL